LALPSLASRHSLSFALRGFLASPSLIVKTTE
jgi:hypothetical protein